jgi:hypothetical protein
MPTSWRLAIDDDRRIFLPMTDPLEKKKQPDSPPEEIEIGAEELLGHPISGNPAERIEALQKRIAYLEDQRRRGEHTDEPLKSALLQRTDSDLAEARQQLKEWQAQHEGRN